MKKNTVFGLGIAAGLVGMSLVSTASYASLPSKDCSGAQRLVCSSDAVQTYRVDKSTDSVTAPEEGSLRWAIEQANASPGLDEIVVAPGLNIQVEETVMIEDGLLLRGEGDASSRATIGSAEEETYNVFEVYEVEDADSVVQVENLSFDGQGLDMGGFLVNDTVGGFGMYDTSMRGFSEPALDVSPEYILSTVVIENSEFTNNGVGPGVVIVNSEDTAVTVEIRNTRFVDNNSTAVNLTGALANWENATAKLEITGSDFINNVATDETAGALLIGGVYLDTEEPQEVHLDEPFVHLEGNYFSGNVGEYAGAVYVGDIHGNFEEATNATDFGELVVVDRTTFDNNRASDIEFGANDISVEYAESYGAAETPEACLETMVPIHILNSTFSAESADFPAVRFSQAECGALEIDHSTFVGSGIATGDTDADLMAALFLRNTVFDTQDEQPLTTAHERTPFQIIEDHVAYSTAPDAEFVPEGAGRVVAPSSDLALGDFTTVDAENDGLAYKARVRVPGIIAGTDPEEASVLTGAGVTVADPRLALDQAGDPRPGAASTTRAATQPTVGAVEGTAPKEIVPPGPVDPENPKPVDPTPVDPKPVDPAPVAPKVEPHALANTGSAMNATNWFILGGILLVAGLALVGGSRFFKKKDAAAEPGSENDLVE